MKKLLLILSIAFLASCGEKPGGLEGKTESNYEIHYIKDSRTGLCYAERGFGKSYTFTCVPCSEEVENLIAK